MQKQMLRLLFLGVLLSSVTVTPLYSQDGDATKGKALFNSNCAACHQLDKKMTGPALRYAKKRLYEDEGLDRTWLNAWIRNSSSLIKSGDAYANKIYNEYNGAAMTAYSLYILLAYASPDLIKEELLRIQAFNQVRSKPSSSYKRFFEGIFIR
jgi:mono/diheme cytochrome c family protein